jgi:predicted permease
MPDWRAEVRRRLARAALRPTREMEIVEEIAQHVEERYARLVAAGASDEEAIAGAWRELDTAPEFEAAIAHLETAPPLLLPPPRPPARGAWVATLWQDVRYSARALRLSPMFSVTVILAIALSIGPVTAIISIANWLFWRPHPGVADASQLATVWFGEWRGNGLSVSGVSQENLDDMMAVARTITGIAGVQESGASLSIPGQPPRILQTALVTGNFFEVLAVSRVAGRFFAPEEDRGRFGAPVVVLSSGLAITSFGSAEGAIGRTLLLNSRPFTVIGVAAPAFRGVSSEGRVDAWITGATWAYLNHVKDPHRMTRSDGLFYNFVVRSAAGVTFDAVDRELKLLSRRLAESHPADNAKFGTVTPRVFPGLGLQPLTRARMSTLVNTLLGVGLVLLLLGCANVANLLVFRATRRAHEIGVRKALGASRGRLLQLQLTESWMLALIGAAIGLALAVYLKQVIEQLLFPKPPGMAFAVPIDLRVLGATLGGAVATGTMAALAPAWLVTRRRGLAAIARSTVTSPRAPRLRTTLAVLQLALSLFLLVGALLLITTLRHLRAVDLGLDPAGVTVLWVNPGEHGHDAATALAYHRQVLPTFQAQPGFAAVSLSALAPFGSSTGLRLLPDGGDPERPLQVRGNGVSEDYFAVLSIPLVHGRPFTAVETAGGGEPSVILNETLARRLFTSTNAVGRTVRLARSGSTPEQDLRVVGVARDSRWRNIVGEQDLFLYRPFAQWGYRVTEGTYLIKSSLPAQQVGQMANAIAGRIDAAIPFSPGLPLSSRIDQELQEERVFAWMLGLLAALGFTLAALGLYGLVAQATTERRREFGIRLALGAAASDIVRLVVRFAGGVATVGIVIGLGLSVYGTRLVRSMLYGVTALEPTVYLGAVFILACVVAIAVAIPVRGALRVSPIEILRAE